ncbi:unnamed protein product [Cladocopium goreaui]|uniref:Transcription elongation factor A protein 2 n=1 Tax=Cladocopium goreaui TaxID=2562237 RepID=A0A9P1DRY3_9DINO|nr:unnamed protein product [Cladocopium goreaui]
MPLPVVLSSCVDAISNRLEELVCHCQELHRENQTLQMENASLRLQQAGAADRRPQVPLLVLPPEVQTLEARVKEVFLEPEQSIELPSAAGPSPDTSIMLSGDPEDSAQLGATTSHGHSAMETVLGCKRTLEASDSSVEQLKAVLQELRNLGELSTKVLAETKIGLAVNQLSKASHGSEELRDMAKCLVQDWKQLHRKRKGVAESESPKKAARGAPVAPETPKKAPPVTGARLKVLEKLQDALKEASLRCGSVEAVSVEDFAGQLEEEPLSTI